VFPTFTWNADPVAFSFPRDPATYVIAGAGALLLLYGIVRKSGESAFFGLLMGAASWLLRAFADDRIEIRWYSLLFVGVFLGGYLLLNWQIKRGGGDEEDAGDFIVFGVLGVLVGARLGHVIFYDYEKALRDPAWIFKIWTGGLASHGAVIGLILAMYLFTKRRGVSFLEGSDRFAFSAALGATLVRIGNFFNSEIVGRKTDGTWGVRFPNYTGDRDGEVPLRHPSQLYEVTLGLLVLLGLYVADRKWGKEERPRGALISLFFVLYFPGRFLIEFVKEYQSPSEADWPLSMGQFLSIPGAALGFYGLYWSFKNRYPAGWQIPDSYDEEFAEDEQFSKDDELYRKGSFRDADVDDEFGGRRTARRAKTQGKPKPTAEPSVERPLTTKKKKKKKKKKKRAELAGAVAGAPSADTSKAPEAADEAASGRDSDETPSERQPQAPSGERAGEKPDTESEPEKSSSERTPSPSTAPGSGKK
jgi:phosphatidylglycerol:prolipoprotein diacylglycerol transferase